ncbi:MAG: LacI family transcriptional regulator, partial [Opitutaceae bacterium]|nr:LacI family transcriptional regulator [Opitutaceae bacterium]
MSQSRARTLSDIAKAAGVSRMTVSLALRNHPAAARATRERIQKLAGEMGYRPSPLISALMTSVRRRRSAPQSVVLAFIVDAQSVKRPTLGEYLQGARRRAGELGFKLDVFTYGDDDGATHGDGMTAARLDSILYARGVAGVIIAPLFEPGKTLSMNWERYAVTALGYSMPAPALHRVVNHQIRGITIALERLAELGYTRPGLALDDSDDVRVFHNWLAGYLAYAHLHGKRKFPPPFITKEWNRRTFAAWFKKHRPDAVLTLKEDVLPWIKACGVSVPEDAGLAILNWEPDSGGVAGIDQDSVGVGVGAVDVTVSQIHANERGVPAQPKIT